MNQKLHIWEKDYQGEMCPAPAPLSNARQQRGFLINFPRACCLLILYFSLINTCFSGIVTQGKGSVQKLSEYGNFPLSFIKNEGQLTTPVLYYEQARGHASYLTRRGIHFVLRRAGKNAQYEHDLKFVGARTDVSVKGYHPRKLKVNYFLGSNSEKWLTDIPTYGEVTYKDLYPGIDVRFYGHERRLEYDIVVAPGVDPSQVVFAYEGVEGLRVTAAGELEVQLNDGVIKQNPPVLFQEIEGRRVAVSGRFRLLNDTDSPVHHSYGFEIGSYDQSYSLIIDPVLVYSTYLGGSNHEFGSAIAVDGSGNAYIAGETRSLNYPTAVAYQGSLGGDEDIILSKINPSGTALLYSTYVGGNNEDEANGIALDTAGNILITGKTESVNYPVTVTAYQSTKMGEEDAFISKFSSSGVLLYSSYLGGTHEDEAFAITVDSSDNVYVAGVTESTDFPVLAAYQSALAGDEDAFVAKLNTNASGNASLIYATYLGGSDDDQAYGIAVDALGRAYVTGETETSGASSFPITASAYQSTAGGNEDVFVSRIGSLGNSLEYSTYLGGKKKDIGHAIALSGPGIVYVTGETRSKAPNPFPVTATAFQLTNGGNLDVFVTKLDMNATGAASMVFSTYLGGNNKDIGYGIVVDGAGNAYVTGQAKSINPPFPVTASAFQSANAGDEDVFLAEINSTGDNLLYSTYFGGKKNDIARGIAMDSSGAVYITGQTRSKGAVPFPTTSGAYQTVNAGDEDAFVVKFGPVPPLAITILSLADATMGAIYSQTLSATGGTTPYSWTVSAGTLPAGLVLNSATGVISGTATTVGTSNFTIQLTDANLVTTTQALSITVNPGLNCAATSTGNNIAVVPLVGITVTFPAVTLGGNTCASLSSTGPVAPTGYHFNEPIPYKDITTTAAFTGPVQVCFNFNSADFVAITTLKLFHHNGTNWTDITSSLNTTTNVICGLTSSFLPFAIGEEASTAITLTDFTVNRQGSHALINWTTSSETDNWGFRILRSELPKGPFTPITSSLIPARGGPGLSITYSYTDRQAISGKTYYYRLEDVSTQGLVTAHNTVQLNDPRETGTALASVNTRSTTASQPEVRRSSPALRGVTGNASLVSAPTVGGTLILSSRSQTVAHQATPQQTIATPVSQPVDSSVRPRAASLPRDDGADPVYTLGQPAISSPGMTNTPRETDTPRVNTQPSTAFSVSIRDARGNVIEVNRLADHKAATNPTELTISKEKGYPHIQWQVKKLVARGFKVLRRIKDQAHYQPVVNYVPNYGEDDQSVYEYAFTDHSAKQGQQYDYRLEVVTWGIQTAAVH